MPDPSSSPTTVLVVKGTINKGEHVASRLYWGMYLRGTFSVPEAPVRAQACVSGLGYCDLLVNGVRVGDHRLDPGQTEYGKAALYASHDATGLVKAGTNVAQVVLGNGRYVEAYGFGPPRVSLQLVVEFADGRRQVVVTDGSWRCSHGPIRQNGIYEGEHLRRARDARRVGRSGLRRQRLASRGRGGRSPARLADDAADPRPRRASRPGASRVPARASSCSTSGRTSRASCA